MDLYRTQIIFRIFVISQPGNATFNRYTNRPVAEFIDSVWELKLALRWGWSEVKGTQA